ncbi:MAG: tRNA guanosine(34) transglycosylase Tgt [Candidatus Andersenbacteria bacterium]
MFSFQVKKQLGEARFSVLTTPHGSIPGPFFQFVATQAAIRGMVFTEDLQKLGVDILLANTYHLHLRPGEDIVAAAGGLHEFMQWERPITTDSGGYQVFSLGTQVTVDPGGVTFRSPRSGDLVRFTPESTMQMQAKLGADIIMPLDVCTPYGASLPEVARAVEQTTEWAKRCQLEHERLQSGRPFPQVVYGIVQGGVYPDLREKSAASLRELNFFGYSIGGELRDQDDYMVEEGVLMTTPHLPADKPRYLMGSGAPEDIVRAVRAGIDQFDCVLPVRNARHGKVYMDLNTTELIACLRDPARPVEPARLYTAHDMRKSIYARDFSVFSPANPATERAYSRAYVHHLLRAEPLSGVRLTVLHNIHFYVQLLQAIRQTIEAYGS